MQTSRSWCFRAIVLAGLAAVLVWQVISRSLVAYLAAVAPEAALILRPTNPMALVSLADKALNFDLAEKDAKPAGTIVPDQASPDDADATLEASGRIPAFAMLASKGASDNRNTDPAAKPVDPFGPAERETREQIRDWAELALLNDPLNARALRILGQLSHGAADEERAAKLMQGAANRSLRESMAVHWLMQKSLEKKDHISAIQYADVLLRTRRRFAEPVTATLVQIAENKEASGELKKLLAENPPWRAEFFSAALHSITDARTPLDLLLSIKHAPSPPTAAELRAYLNFLIEHKFEELAHYAWLQFLSPEQLNGAGLLFNGSFEFLPSGLPFDWVIAPGSGVTIDTVARPNQDGQHALFMEFGHGRVDFGGITQLILLSPGSYQIKGKFKGQLRGRRGFEWRVTCAGGETMPIGKSPMVTGVTPAWQEFEFFFTVPDVGCRAQHLRLELAARSASEQLVSGSLWYDELNISRMPESENPT